MKVTVNLWVAGFSLILAQGALHDAKAQSCDLVEASCHGDEHRTLIYASETGVPALYFKADMDVNTDGAARSYHPRDPRGEEIALNNIANAISKIYDAHGKDITCSPRRGSCYTRFIETFEAARDADYKPSGAPRVSTRGMIPWEMDETLGWEVPCTIKSGANAGFFVSPTSVVVDRTKSACDQDRYLDSLRINANVLPKNVGWRAQGVLTDKTDVVVARDLETGRIAYGINGDRGPANKIGEGSVAFTAALSGRQLAGDETYEEIKKLARPNVEYLIFPTHDIERLVGSGFTQADIDRVGREVLADWGGVARLDACQSLPK